MDSLASGSQGAHDGPPSPGANLPRALGAAHVPTRANPPGPHDPIPISPFGRPLRILMADDNMVNQRLMYKLLVKRGPVELALVGDGRQAVDRVKGHETFDLIFMDVTMPVMDGIQATKEIWEFERSIFRKRTPIVAMHSVLVPQLRNLGVEHLLLKPIMQPALYDTIQQALKPDSTECNDGDDGWVFLERDDADV